MNLQVIPDVLAWPLQKALIELERLDLPIRLIETSLPEREYAGTKLRVARTKVCQGVVELVVVKVQTEPVDKVPPV